MILIAHRGNIDGRIPSRENHPDYINEAIKEGYDVEIDVWWTSDGWYLGHDEPQYKVYSDFFFNPKLWIHCKNAAALERFNKWNNLKYFWHANDDYTLISNGMIWVYPGKELLKNSICCMPEWGYGGDLSICYAVCTDEILKYKELI